MQCISVESGWYLTPDLEPYIGFTFTSSWSWYSRTNFCLCVNIGSFPLIQLFPFIIV